MRVQHRLTREETASLLEGISGQKPKDGFRAIAASSTVDGGMSITWLDAEGEAPKPPEEKGGDAEQSGDS